jgi:hypothetical protein
MNSRLNKKSSKQTHLSRPVVLSFPRHQIETGDLSPLIFFLMGTTSGEDVWLLKNSMSFCFDGYQDDARELWQIPDVQRYLQKMFSVWTEWMFFVSLTDESLLISVLSITNAELVKNSSQITLRQDATKKVACAMDGIQAVFNDYGFPIVEKNRIAMAILQYLSQKLTPRMFDGIHRPVSESTGESVNVRSVRTCMATHVVETGAIRLL